jgi:hypothetical protein
MEVWLLLADGAPRDPPVHSPLAAAFVAIGLRRLFRLE